MQLVAGSDCWSRKRWRYTWEALGHIPTLRLFLFRSELEPSDVRENLEASLSLGESLVVVKWREKAVGELELRVPLPRVVIDPVAPVQVLSRKDHIEVKLMLVLPPDHPMSTESRAASHEGENSASAEEYLPLSFDSGE